MQIEHIEQAARLKRERDAKDALIRDAWRERDALTEQLTALGVVEEVGE